MDSIPVRIIADTNILRAQDNRALFSGDLAALTAAQPGVSKKVFVAEITLKEIVYQKTAAAKEARVRLEAAANTLLKHETAAAVPVGWKRSIGAAVKVLHEKVNSDGFGWTDLAKAVTDAAKAELAKFKVHVVKTPIKQIDWARVVDDAVFIETVVHAWQQDADSTWCVLTNDDKVIDRLQAIKKARNVDADDLEIFRSVADCQSFIKLLLQKYESAAARMLPGLATLIFHDPEKETGLWLSADLETKIRAQFQAELDALPTVPRSPYDPNLSAHSFLPGATSFSMPISTSAPILGATGYTFPPPFPLGTLLPDWSKTTDERWLVENTRFLERGVDGVVKWATRINAFSLYSRLLHSVSVDSLHFPSAVIKAETFDVFWSAHVALMVITQPAFEKVEHVESSLHEASWHNCLQLGFSVNTWNASAFSMGSLASGWFEPLPGFNGIGVAGNSLPLRSPGEAPPSG